MVKNGKINWDAVISFMLGIVFLLYSILGFSFSLVSEIRGICYALFSGLCFAVFCYDKEQFNKK